MTILKKLLNIYFMISIGYGIGMGVSEIIVGIESRGWYRGYQACEKFHHIIEERP